MALEPLSRRMLLTTMGAVAGAAALGSRLAMAQTPPRGRLHAARARSPPRRGISAPTRRPAPTSRIRTSSASNPLQSACGSGMRRIQRLWTGALWSEGPAWSSQGRYLVWSDIPNNRQLRWLEDNGRVSVFRMPVEQQQRQHLRLPGTAALVRAPDPARGPLRARRRGDGARGGLQRQAAQLAQRRRGRIRTAATGSPIRPTAASSMRARRMPRAGRATCRDGSIPGSASRPEIGRGKRELPEQRVSRGPQRAGRSRGERGSGAQSQRARVLARLQEALRHQHGQGTGGHRAREARARCSSSTWGATTSFPTEALQRLHGRRGQVRAGRRALRRRRQRLVLEQWRPQRGL